MLSIFKRKRCKQCGEELKMFTNVDFCTLRCSFKFNYPKGIEDPWMVEEIPIDAYGALNDILYEIHKRKPTKLEIVKGYIDIPKHIHTESNIWGWDTVVKEDAYKYLRGELTNE